LSFSGFQAINEHGESIRPDGNSYVSELYEKASVLQNGGPIVYHAVSFNLAISTGNLVFTRSLYNKIGGFADYRLCHDWDFLLKATQHTEVVSSSLPLYMYRVHSTNTFSNLGDLVAYRESADILKGFIQRADRNCSIDRSGGIRKFMNHFRRVSSGYDSEVDAVLSKIA
jgi:hypothetical protein